MTRCIPNNLVKALSMTIELLGRHYCWSPHRQFTACQRSLFAHLRRRSSASALLVGAGTVFALGAEPELIGLLARSGVAIAANHFLGAAD